MDALDYALDAMITQSGSLVIFHFETFSETIIRYWTYEKELYTIVQALQQWRHYILGKEMIILTDHKNLQFASSQSKL